MILEAEFFSSAIVVVKIVVYVQRAKNYTTQNNPSKTVSC